jgi:hypothetical protein
VHTRTTLPCLLLGCCVGGVQQLNFLVCGALSYAITGCFLTSKQHSPLKSPAFQAFTLEADALRVAQLLVGAVAVHAPDLWHHVPATATQSGPALRGTNGSGCMCDDFVGKAGVLRPPAPPWLSHRGLLHGRLSLSQPARVCPDPCSCYTLHVRGVSRSTVRRGALGAPDRGHLLLFFPFRSTAA